MRWLEIIELRTVDCNRGQLESQIQKLIGEMNREAKKREVKAYLRAVIDTDFRIHLLHNSMNIEHGGSSLGLSLASALKEFGLVNHSIWIEMKSK